MTNDTDSLSPYYPPRARWYRPWLSLADAVKRRLRLDRIRLPSGMPPRHFIAGLLLPGVAFYLRGKKFIGRLVLLGCAALLAVFILWLGYPVGNVAFGLLLSVHATSVLFLLEPWLVGARFIFRLLLGLAVLVLIGGGLYSPLRRQLQAHGLMPLRVNGQVVVVQNSASPQSVARGDWIAYELPGRRLRDVVVRDGLGFGPVLGAGGDRIQFTSHAFRVNDSVLTRRPNMPVSGELVVPKNHWFVWPDLVIDGNRNAAAASAAMLELAVVPESAFVGKAFQRWFWRRQILP